MIERPGGGNVAVLVSLDFGAADYTESLEELHQLAVSAGLEVCARVEGRRDRLDPACFIGKG